ncbi:MAG TPA: condensation domain-containing protein, partial [Thermoanaerobaculia bacterium]|nr:condensation domain-containing protein [Thermoanaerobaculia bacterium]
LEGELDAQALTRSLDEVVRRHHVLRTTFEAPEGTPRQVVGAPPDRGVPLVDLAGLPQDRRRSEAGALCRREARRAFDLSRGPLLRALLLRERPEEHHLFLNLHHVAADGESLDVLGREVSALYVAFSAGVPSPLADLPLQYADFAVWQRDCLDAVRGQLAYWKERLSAPLPALELPADRPRPAVRSRRGGTLVRELPSGLAAWSRQRNVTLFMTLLAGLKAFLCRVTGQEDLLVGVPVSNRRDRETEGLIGCFVNTLALRTDLRGDPGFGEVLERVRETALGAWSHQELPFETLVEELQPERDPDRDPLLQALCTFRSGTAEPLALPGLTATVSEIPTGTARLDLTLALVEHGGRLTASLEYSSDLFDAATAQHLLDRYVRLLEAATEDAERPVSQLPLLSEAELATLPRTPGKEEQTPGPARQSPRTPLEELLAVIWEEVLECDRVGVEESFFALGGHSLLATRVVSRLRQSLGIELPLRAVFEAPTIARLARRIEGLTGRQSPGIEPVERREPPPASFSQQRLWFIDQIQPGNPAYNLAAAVQLDGGLDPEALARSLEAVVRRHESLRTTFAAPAGPVVQVIAQDAQIDLPQVDLSGLAEPEEQVRRLSARHAQQPFDLARGPLLRALLLRLREERHVLVFSLHHIAGDAWSLAILSRDLGAFYAAFAEGRAAHLPALPIQYADFSHWQLRQELAEEAAYWKRRLAGAPPEVRLPCDGPRPDVPSHRGASLEVALSAELAAALRQLGRSQEATPFMVLLTAFLALLHGESGQDDLVVGTDVANRRHRETEDLIGFFVNSLVLRADLGGDPTFFAALARVREACLEAYAHQDLPFQRMVEVLQPRRDLGRNPLFQVMFILQNAPAPEVRLPGLTLTPLPLDPGATAFDLSVSLGDREDGGLQGTFRYSTDLFSAATIARMIDRFESLLRGAAAQPEARLSRLTAPAGPVGGEAVSGYRLSPQQRRLWLAQGEAAFQAWCTVLIRGRLDRGALRAAVARVVERHSILRTSFHRLPALRFPVQDDESTAPSPSWLSLDVQELLDGSHLLLLRLPALCADRRTLCRLAEEVAAAYRLGAAYQPEPLSYVQFAEWQNGVLEGEEAEEWRQRWRDLQLPALDAVRLPFEVPSPGFEPAAVPVPLDAALARQTEALAERLAAPLPVLLLAVWQTLLWRLTGAADFVVGCEVENRGHELLRDALGLFAKWLPVRARLQPDLPFAAGVRQTLEGWDEAVEWQDGFSPGETDAFAFGYSFEEWPDPVDAGGPVFEVRGRY